MVVVNYLLYLVLFFAVSTVVQWIYPSIRRHLSEIVALWLPIFSAVMTVFLLIVWEAHWFTVTSMALTVGLSQGKTETESVGRRLS
jgi:hypothetical protein